MTDDNPNAKDQNNGARMSDEAASKLAAISDMVGTERTKELLGELGGQKSENTTPPVGEETYKGAEDVGAINTEEKPSEEDKGDGSENGESHGDSGEESEIIIKNELLGEQVIGKAASTYDEKDPESIKKFVKSQLGIDEFDQFQSVTKKWRKDSEELAKTQAQYNQVDEILKSLPDQLQNAILMHTGGDNWRDAFDKYDNLDYSKNVADYNKKELVDAIFPGKFTDQDWEEYRDEDADAHLRGRIDDAYEMSKDKFKNSKAAIEGFRAETEKRELAVREGFQRSISRSEEHFRRVFPNADESVAGRLSSGFSDHGVDQLFYNQDGSLREDAHVRYSMAENGLDIIKKYMDYAAKIAVNKHIASEIDEKKGTIRTSGGVGSGGNLNPDKSSDQKVAEVVTQKLGILDAGELTYK